MAVSNPEFWQLCEAVIGATAETITITSAINNLRISSGINDIVYLKFNWTVGDTEVSATNFDICLTARGSTELKHEAPTWPKFENVRVICAPGGSIGCMGW